uniref:EGF-like domain-containing protein n=1 Tax=Strongyloides papillosus TaxID=174720 RepID=A0A0N5BIJ2_STREA
MIMLSGLHSFSFIFPFLVLTLVKVNGERAKVTDIHGNDLEPLENYLEDCSSGKKYGLVDGMLEECDKWKIEAGNGFRNPEDDAYEEMKCKKLRVHGEIRDGKCVCINKWTGSVCHIYKGCPEGQSLYKGACTANICQNDGVLSIGSVHLECRCPAPWQGRYCEHLACWRNTDKAEHDKRFKNAKTKCECGSHYTGENCDQIISCEKGNLTNGICECPKGYYGEICHIKCPHNAETCSASIIGYAVPSILLIFVTLTAYILN